jgi:myo-inositol-1(or 4)-monophosphatase
MENIIETSIDLLEPLMKKIGLELKELFDSRDFDVKYKDKAEIVTTADKLSEKYILEALRKEFPEHRILSEESGKINDDSDSPFLWVIDPVDGTTNFTYHNPFFAIAISLFYGKNVILGLIYNPILDEMYIAKKDAGAYLNGKKINVNDNVDLNKLRLTYCHGNTQESHENAIKLYSYFKKQGDIRQLGSAAMELALVARGITDAFVVPGALRWDVAAGILLIKEADGISTDFNGKEWNYDSEDMLAGNGKINDELLPIINSVL